MNNIDLVSVIVPVYNVAPFIRESINSVINQTYKKLEIVIVDDGSTDESSYICDEFANVDNRVKVIHQKNKGLGGARNTGLKAAHGDAFAFLDSDDKYSLSFIERLVTTMNQEDSDIVMCKYSLFESSSNIQTNQLSFKPSISQGLYTKKEALSSLVYGDINTSVWNKLYRKRVWDNIHFPEGYLYEDRDIIFRVFNNCVKVSVIDDCLYQYRDRRLDSITNNYSEKNIRDWLLANSHFEDFVISNTPDLFNVNHIYIIKQIKLNRMINDYVWLYRRINSSNSKNLIEDLKNQIKELGCDIGIKELSIQKKMCFFIICLCPSLFKPINFIFHKNVE